MTVATQEIAGDVGIFELEMLSAELRSSEAYAQNGQAARTIVRTADLRQVLVVLAAGKTTSEHHASVTASLQVLTGQLRVELPERGLEVQRAGLIVFAAGTQHSVRAQVDSAFLLTLGWPVHVGAQ